MLLILTALTMVVHRPAQLYAAGALGAYTTLVFICLILNLPIPVESLIFPSHLAKDYPNIGILIGFMSFSLAILFRSPTLSMVIAALGLAGTIGHVFGISFLYWYFPQSGTALMSFYTALAFILMSMWLVKNYFPFINLTRYYPSLNKITEWVIQKMHNAI